MGIVGSRPSGGIRFELERVSTTPPWVYEGVAKTEAEDHRLVVTALVSGGVEVDGEAALPERVATRAKLLVRTAVKHAMTEGVSPPRRLHRWRAD
jgi:hypothetical protein